MGIQILSLVAGVHVGVLVAVVAVIALVAARRGGRARFPRRVQRRHIITRIICGAAGAGILVAVGIGTWLEVEAAGNVTASDGDQVLHLPARPWAMEANRLGVPPQPRQAEAVSVEARGGEERIESGRSAMVRVDALPGRTFAARVEMTETRTGATPRDSFVKAHLRLGGDIRDIREGMTCEVTFPGRDAPPLTGVAFCPGPAPRKGPLGVRLLWHLLLVDATSGYPQVVQTRELDVRVPESGQVARTVPLRTGQTQISVEVRVGDLYVHYPLGKPQLQAHWSSRVDRSGPGERGSSSAEGVWPVADQVVPEAGADGMSPPNGNPLSVLPCVQRRGLYIVLLVDPAEEEDPLKEMSSSEFAKATGDRVLHVLAGDQGERLSAGRAFQRVMRREAPAGLIGLAPYVGPAGLLLVAAAGLLAQLFLRRPLAMAGLLAVMVLYVAGMDRLALGRQLSIARDPAATVGARMNGCVQASGSFFYRDTARRSLAAVARDPATPKELAAAARKTAQDLER